MTCAARHWQASSSSQSLLPRGPESDTYVLTGATRPVAQDAWVSSTLDVGDQLAVLLPCTLPVRTSRPSKPQQRSLPGLVFLTGIAYTKHVWHQR